MLYLRWAWQNPNMTRHIPADSRISQSRMTTRISPKTGKIRKRAKRPRLCLTDRLANLRLLLEAKSFQRWPLKLTFYADDVHRMWQRLAPHQRPGLEVALHTPEEDVVVAAKIADASLPVSVIGLNSIDVTYYNLKSQLEKSQAQFTDGKPATCAVCSKDTPASGAGTLVCTSESCSAVSHLQCLSAAFLDREGAGADHMVPTAGKCPKCDHKLQWIDLVKDLSLRMRGEKEVKALFKPKRAKKVASVSAPAEIPDSDDEEESDDPLEIVMEEDEWRELSDSGDDDVPEKGIQSDPSAGHEQRTFKKPTNTVPFSEPIIQDSEDSDGWSDAEVIR